MKPKIDFGALFFAGVVVIMLAGVWGILAQRTSGSAQSGGQAPLATGYPAASSAQVQPTAIANLLPTLASNPDTIQSSGYPAPGSPQTSGNIRILTTPTLLPDSSKHLSTAVDLMNKSGLAMATTGGFRLTYPATDGKTLVGLMASDSPAHGTYVVALDLATGAEQQITDVPGYLTGPVISDRYIVWAEDYKLKFYERTTGKKGEVSLGGLARDFSLSGTTLVWENLPDPSASYQLWGYDLSSGRDFAVVKDGWTSRPLISGRWVIYEGVANGNKAALYAINLDTLETIELGELNIPLRYLYTPYAIDAPWVVWTFGAGDDQPELHFYNLDTHQANKVVVPSCSDDDLVGRPERPAISTPIVFFDGCLQYMAYDFQAGSFFSVPIDRLQAQAGGIMDWTFAKGQLIWVSSSDHWGKGPVQLYMVTVTGGK